MIQLGFPTAHRLTFLSSPPVTRTLPDLCPSARQFTFAPCATNSSVITQEKIKNNVREKTDPLLLLLLYVQGDPGQVGRN